MSEFPLDSYRICVIKTSAKTFAILQMCLSLFFGEHSATLSNPPTPKIEQPVRSLRHHGFRDCPHTNAAHQIDVPRDECVEYSRYGHQGCRDILCRDIYIPLLDLDYFCCGKGGIICTSA